MIGRVKTACWLGGVLVLAGCSAGRAAPGPSPQPVHQAPKGPYVALGDSYTAGIKVLPAGGGPRGCGRSAANYPSLVAQELGLAAQFTDVSCSSATTADLTAAQSVDGGANPAQLDALNDATRLVTLGIGGNDAGFMQVVTRCAELGLLDAIVPKKGQDAPCRAAYQGADGTDQLTAKLGTVGDRLAAVLGDVRKRAPKARVYVVGYPALLPADPAACGPVLGRTLPPGDLAFLAEQEQRLNTVLRKQAQDGGAVFVDTYTPSAGHDMCAGEAARWIEPPFPAAGRAPLHPNAAGQQAMARVVATAIKG